MTSHLLARMRLETNLVDEIIFGVIGEGYPRELYGASRHLLEAGGKRFRGYVALSACKALGGDPVLATPTAAAVELIHNLTLIHDDIIDKDVMRRGVQATHVAWGTPTSMIAADFLMSKAYLCVLESVGKVPDSKIVRVIRMLSSAGASLSEGQAMDILFETAENVSEEEYFKMASKKTAALFRAAAGTGAVIAGGTEEQIRILEQYGFDLGMGFQLVDDILGVAGDEVVTGKPVGSDIREGKKTLLLMKALEKATPSDREFLLKVLGNREAPQNSVLEAVDAVKRSGATGDVEALAQNYAEKAIQALKSITPEGNCEELIELAQVAVRREF